MSRTPLVLAFAIASALALGACSKNEGEGTTQPQPEPQTPPATTPAEPPPAAEPAPPAGDVEQPMEAVRVSSVDLGTAVGEDQRITDATTSFKPDDTIYAAVSTEGAAPNAVLHARWTFGDDDQVVNESSQTIAPSGPAVTSFHISKADGWPAGDYKVQISLDGEQVASEEFKVEE